MFWSTMVSCDPGDCEGAADAGARPAVIPATVATIAAPAISDAINLCVFIVSPLLVGRGRPYL
jgi:hypothetical protein